MAVVYDFKYVLYYLEWESREVYEKGNNYKFVLGMIIPNVSVKA